MEIRRDSGLSWLSTSAECHSSIRVGRYTVQQTSCCEHLRMSTPSSNCEKKLTRLESDVALSARYASASSLTVSWSRRLTAISSQRDCGVTHFQRQHRNNDNNVALCMPCCGTVPRSRSSRLIGSPERQVILSTVTRSGCPRFDRCQDLHAFSTTRVSRLHMHVAETFSILRMQKQNRDGSYKSYQIFGPL